MGASDTFAIFLRYVMCAWCKTGIKDERVMPTLTHQLQLQLHSFYMISCPDTEHGTAGNKNRST